MIEYCPNPECVGIHTKQRLVTIEEHIVNAMSFRHGDARFKEQRMTALMMAIQELDGVVEWSVSQYHIQLIKAKAYRWDEILQKVQDLIWFFLEERVGDGVDAAK